MLPVSYNLSAGGIWITIQLTFAVICCCLPTMRPVFEKVDSFVSRSTSYFTSSLRTPASGNTGGSSKDNIGGFNRLDVDQESEGWVPARSNAVITREDVKPGQRLEYPLGAISVQRSVDIVWVSWETMDLEADIFKEYTGSLTTWDDSLQSKILERPTFCIHLSDFMLLRWMYKIFWRVEMSGQRNVCSTQYLFQATPCWQCKSLEGNLRQRE